MFGWRCPTIFFLDGSVTSMTSFFICSSRIARSIFTFLSSITFSMASLVSLTIWPTFGLSSGATSFIPLSTAVSSPFLPRYFTRTSFNFSGRSACSIAFNASSLMLCNFSFILLSPFYILEKPRPQKGTRSVFTRGTTLIPARFIILSAIMQALIYA